MTQRLFTLLALLLGISLSAFGQEQQTKLPPCPPPDNSKKTDNARIGKWHKCFGKFTVQLDEFLKGDTYEGEFFNGKLNGYGHHKSKSGNLYGGSFKNGQYHGVGTLVSADGVRFSGIYVEGRRKGYGIQKLLDGSMVIGEWNGHDLLLKYEETDKKNVYTDQNENYINSLFSIKPQFDKVSKFSEELAVFQTSQEKFGGYGYINSEGRIQIEPNYLYATDFKEGLAAVVDQNTGLWGFIDKHGKYVIAPKFEYLSEFSEGRATFRVGSPENEKYGYIDTGGNVVVPAKYDYAMDFSEGYARVNIGDPSTGDFGLINKAGEFVIKPRPDLWVGKFSGGLATVGVRTKNEDTKWGFINRSLQIVIEPKFDNAGDFSEGLAYVTVNKKIGFIDTKGNQVIAPQFDNVWGGFQENFAAVQVGGREKGKWGFIDKSGKFVINPIFDYVRNFSEGLAAVRLGDSISGKWGYIEKSGKFIVSPKLNTFISRNNSSDNFFERSFSERLAASCVFVGELQKCGFISIDLARKITDATPSNALRSKIADVKKDSFKINITHTSPDLNGTVNIVITTNADTSSLKINGEEQGGRPDGIYKIKRVARVGQDTQFTIAAVDIMGNTDSTTITVARQAVPQSSNQSVFLKPENIKRAATRDAVAIIIGIQNYKRVPKAEFANNDAKEFYEYAIRGLGIKPENIKLLLDEEADEVNIVKAFRNWLPLQVTKNKTDVYVFYSGHGLPAPDGKSLYFLPHAVDEELLDRTAVGQNEIVTALISAIPKSVTMFIDACYSGQTRGGEVLLASAKPMALKADTNVFPLNFTVITASANDQISSSSPELKHGIFSFYLMKGMEGDADGNKDGKITAGEMQEYLSDKVSRQAMSMSRKQDTQLVGDPSRVLVGQK